MERSVIFAGFGGRQVAVALVGEHEGVRPDTPDAGRDRRGAPMGCLDEVDADVVVCEDGAPDRCHGDGPRAKSKLAQDLRDQPVDDPVPAAGAVVGAATVSYTHLRAHETDSYLV